LPITVSIEIVSITGLSTPAQWQAFTKAVVESMFAAPQYRTPFRCPACGWRTTLTAD
jgi:hypothetical protein